MARKAKADRANGTGDDEHQTAAPGMGHNGDALSEDQKIARFFSYKKRWEAARLTLKNLEEEIKTEIGKKSIRDIRLSIQLDTPEGEERLKDKMEAQIRVAKWMGLPVGAQEDMFPEDRTPAVDASRARGKRDGLAGNAYKPECDPSVPQHAAYSEGFNEGQHVLAQGFKPFPPAEEESALRPRFKQHADA